MTLIALALLTGCAQETTPTSPVACPECPTCPEAAPAANALDEWEQQMLAPHIEAVKAGVTPTGDRGFGVCTGSKKCGTYLGSDPGELPPGDYVIRAELAVPSIGEGWQARFAVSCDGAGSTAYEKVYKVSYSGAGRGYRLDPLRSIHSPHRSGEARSCTFEMVPIRPDGKELEAMTGSYSTPAR